MSSQLLLSLPPNLCAALPDCDPELAARCFATCDPPETQLGSGGGTVWLLEQAWRASGVPDFAHWLEAGLKLLVHAGGESRRLPAYAATGKLLMPVPALRWKYGQRIDQTLLDMQEPFLRRVAERAGRPHVLIASGDVLLCGTAERIPEADVVLLGMWTTPEEAAHFGVMFCDRQHPERLVKFLQKPDPFRTRELSREHLFLVDVGVWLLSPKAVRCLLRQCGRDPAAIPPPDRIPDTVDLYGEWALALGSEPEKENAEIAELSVAVVPVRDGEFYHFGKSRDIIESAYRLQNKVMDQTRLGAVPTAGQPRQFVLNAAFDARRSEANESIWIENSCVSANWKLAREHVITGVPDNHWALTLEPGRCLDLVPVDEALFAARPYGFEDAFRGPVSDPATRWMGNPVTTWLERRGLTLAAAELDPAADLQAAPLFPLIEAVESDGPFIQWLLDENPMPSDAFRRRWLEARRLSARELGQQADLTRLYAQRRAFCARALPVMARHGATSLFYKLDISRVAREYAAAGLEPVPEAKINWRGDRLLPMHDSMFRSVVAGLKGDEAAAREYEAESFNRLNRMLIGPFEKEIAEPRCAVMEDQIVWARSPARVDIAGGWSDTPPYCLEHGGAVFNLALDLNGQPPVQVFVRLSEQLRLIIRSIDLGLKEELATYDEVGRFRGLGSGFAIARAAFALAGFYPAFNGGRFKTLEQQLEAFGGGIEVSLLAALPKGSGMGTSSILAGTLLGGLSEFCGLGWDCMESARRVSAVEQMLGSGGGWQDQYGGLLPGAKLIETRPGLAQEAAVRWAPDGFFDAAIQEGRMLLYYTGITRVAHNVLAEIVRNMFLNQANVLETIEAIAENGQQAFEAAQRQDWPGFVDVVRKSWALNQALDTGTNPPEVQALIERVRNHCAALKLAGAGGGGYLFLLTETRDAAAALRQELTRNPPNAKARFVEPSLSRTGLQVSRS